LPEGKFSKYQKKARKNIIKTGASNEDVLACAKERRTLLVGDLQSVLLGHTDLNSQLAEAARLQRNENSKPENIVFCKYMADRLLSFHTREAAEFDREPSSLILADAKRANLAYDNMAVDQRSQLDVAAKTRVDEAYASGGLKRAADMCMPGFFTKSARVVSPLEADDRNFTINFGPQHPAAQGVLRAFCVKAEEA